MSACLLRQLRKVKAHPAYTILLDTVETFVPEFHPRQLANVFWAVRPVHLAPAIIALFARVVPLFLCSCFFQAAVFLPFAWRVADPHLRHQPGRPCRRGSIGAHGAC